MDSSRFHAFDGVRALAIIAVFLAHRTVLGWTALGHMGVVVFFALSGFLIFGILYNQRLKLESETADFRTAAGDFFRKRLLRICPIYFLALGVVALAAWAGFAVEGWTWASAPWHAVYLSNAYQGQLAQWQWQLAHLWSLSVEFWFYVLAGPIFLLAPALWHRRLCLAIIVAGVLSHLSLLASGASRSAMHVDFLTNFATMAFGGYLALAFRERTMPSPGNVALVCAALLCAMAITPHDVPMWLWQAIHVAAPICAGLFIAALPQANSHWLVRALSFRPLVELGVISYGFYLYHNFIKLTVFEGVGWAYVLSNFAFVVGLAWLSFRFIETPLNQWAKNPTPLLPKTKLA